MPDRHDLYRRAVDRAHALAEQWQGDQSPMTRAQAAEQLMDVIQLSGWTQTDAPVGRHLSLASDVPCPSGLLPAGSEPVDRCARPAGHKGGHQAAGGAAWLNDLSDVETPAP